MFSVLPSWWNAILEEDADAKPPPSPLPDRMREPLAVLPRAIEWTDDLEAWSRIDYQSPMSRMEMMQLQRACNVRGSNAAKHAARREKFSRLKSDLAHDGYSIPAVFTSIISDDSLFNRFRFPCQSFTLPDAIVPYPEDEQLRLFLILSDAQGCNFTHLLLSSDGRHTVTRSMHPYGLRDAAGYTNGTPEEMQIYAYADSIETLVCWSVDEINEFESQAAEDWVIQGNQMRNASDTEQAEAAYRLGLAYDPGCQSLLDRPGLSG
ncbi:MAG TPA: hypothetical protein VMM76_05775 [Pirellulaceae bacterium]|nr:hypothetical protein [Pirellulaceae bacterium]